MNVIELNWVGPFQFGVTPFDDVPNSPAVYVWTVDLGDKHLIVYVGESSRLVSRWSEHLWWLLGGQYQVYDSEKLRRGEIDVKYGFKDPKRHLNTFSRDFAHLAIENAETYRLWYARLDAPEFVGRPRRMAVESAIHARLAGDPELAKRVTNGRRSVLSRNAPKLRLQNRWPEGVKVAGLTGGECIDYGER